MRLGDILVEDSGDAERSIRLDRPDRAGRPGEAVLRVLHGKRHLEGATIGSGCQTAGTTTIPKIRPIDKQTSAIL